MQQRMGVMTCHFRVFGFLLLGSASAVFVPRPFSDFETGLPPVAGSAEGVRRFAQQFRRNLEDGSRIVVDWEVHTDPETLLELDLDHQRGMSIVRCANDSLVLKVLPEHLARVQKWQHVTGSYLLHGCPHLPDRDLYHRILHVGKASSLDPADGTHTVRIKTQELESPTEIFPFMRMHVSMNPPTEEFESQAVVNRQSDETTKGRRLWTIPSWLKKMKLPGEFDNGGKPSFSSHTTAEDQDDDPQQSAFNFNLPNQVAHFHWNSKYLANTTSDPQFMLKFDGGEGYMKFFHPYVNNNFAHEVNITSEMKQLMKPPQVYVDGRVSGTSNFKLDIATAADFEKDSSSQIMDNVLRELKWNKNNLPFPFMKNFKTDGQDITKTFRPYTLHFGGTPMTITPGFECGMKLYHIGAMNGSMRFGLDATISLEGTTHFDTNSGLMRNNFSAKAERITFTPPTYMIITQHFELGLELLPQVFIKGGFGNNANMKMGFGFVPYFNVTMHQEDEAASAGDLSASSALAIYPFRATGLPSGKSYSVAVVANSVTKQTAFQMSMDGVLEFTNNVQSYAFGAIQENSLLMSPIEVQLFEDGQGDKPIAVGIATCSSMVNGECHPNPATATMQVAGQTVMIQLNIVWQANAMNALETKINSITAKMPGVKIMQDNLLSQIGAGPHSAELRIRINGRVFASPLSPPAVGSAILRSNARWELGPCFLDAWQNSMSEVSVDANTIRAIESQMELVVGGNVVAKGVVPSITWDTAPSESRYEALRQALRNPVDVDQVRAMVAMVPLFGSDSSTALAYGRVEFDVMAASSGSFWVFPYQAEHFHLGESYMFYWTTFGAAPGVDYKFVLAALKVGTNDDLSTTNWKQTIEVNCSKTTGVTIHRYVGGSGDPCIFQYEVQVPESFVGSTYIVVAEWLDAHDMPHYMATTPITFSAENSRRLQQEPGWMKAADWTPNKQHLSSSGLKSEAQLAAMRAQCSATPLKYAVEAGIDYQEIMQNVRLPLPMAMMMGMSTAPDFATPPVAIWRLGGKKGQPGSVPAPGDGKELSDLLPKSICTAGMCQGMMPGCQEEQTKPINIKQMLVKLNRVYDWTKTAGPTVRHIIAYGLSVLPSAVKVEEQQIQQNLQATASNYLTAQANAAQKHYRNLKEAPKALPEMELFIQTPETERDPDIVKLDGLEQEYPLPYDTFKVTLLKNPGYKLTADRVKKLIDNNAFRGLEDGREHTDGPVFITRIELIDRHAEEKSETGDETFDMDALSGKVEEPVLDSLSSMVHKAAVSLADEKGFYPWGSVTPKPQHDMMAKSRLSLGFAAASCIAALAAFATLVVAAVRRASPNSNYHAVAPTDLQTQFTASEFA